MLRTMPSAAARRIYEDQIPPFMSVFDLDAETMADRDTVTLVDPKMVGIETKTPALANPSQQHDLQPGTISDPAHKHHDSTSTQMSESTDSSPTTTLSTTDSSPLSDPSPSSSPDSPINLIPLNNFPSSTFGSYVNGTGTLDNSEPAPLTRPMTSPSLRRPRNMKGLSIMPPVIVTTTSKTPAFEPSSPSFIKPTIPAMKRKPSQLSLKTNTSDLGTKPSLEVVAPSPAVPTLAPILQRRALRHSTSSPHMLSGLKSSTFGPPGGMSLPRMLERNESGLSEVLRPMKSSMNMTFDATIVEEDSPIRTQHANRADYEPYNESVNNEDQKTPGYPGGPIAIYGDNVYLYLEPTANEASKFDLVINVAREVKNPFEARQEKRQSMEWAGRGSPPTPTGDSPIPDTAVTTASFATAFEYQPEDDRWVETPTTPKANPLKTPEYIHMQWDHNTDIAPDLMHLCETIENRTKDGKKVLIHCQQGASRSASLIIAYGLYQCPELGVNDAYYAAQAKSRWISPNMKLMYSLQDFHKELSKRRLPPTSAFRPRTGRSPTKHRLTLSADAIDIPPKEPHTAPLPGDDRPKEGGPNKSPRMSPRARGNSTPGLQDVSPGPSSAPLNFSWKTNMELDQPQPPPVPAFESLPQRPKSELGRMEPNSTNLFESWTKPPSPSPPKPGSHAGFGFQSMSFPSFQGQGPLEPPKADVQVERTFNFSSAYPDDEALMSPRAETMMNNPLHAFPATIAGMSYVEESPPTPTEGLFSPRENMFPRDPFGTFGRPSQIVDPRSPPTKGEAPIIRSIDDIL